MASLIKNPYYSREKKVEYDLESNLYPINIVEDDDLQFINNRLTRIVMLDAINAVIRLSNKKRENMWLLIKKNNENKNNNNIFELIKSELGMDHTDTTYRWVYEQISCLAMVGYPEYKRIFVNKEK